MRYAVIPNQQLGRRGNTARRRLFENPEPSQRHIGPSYGRTICGFA